MASKYNYRGKFYISYTLNGERKVKNTGLEFHQSNEHKAELFRRKVEELEKKLIFDALTKSNGNQSQAGRLLGLTERNLRYKMQKYGIKKFG